MTRIIIIGAVAGGAARASQTRRLDKGSDIIVFGKDRDMSFANRNLPHYIGHLVSDRHQILPTTPDVFEEKKSIVVRTHHEVIGING